MLRLADLEFYFTEEGKEVRNAIFKEIDMQINLFLIKKREY